MSTEEFLQYMRDGNTVKGGSDMHEHMHKLSQEAMQVTTLLNNGYHDTSDVAELFSQLIGKPVGDGFGLFPPFYTDCGKNIFVGKNVFINCGCHFQDQGGVYIDDNALIGSQTVFATLNHGEAPEERADLHPAPIHIGKNVWIGSHVTILQGVSIGENSIVAAGAVVTKDVPANTVAAGVPAKVIKQL